MINIGHCDFRAEHLNGRKQGLPQALDGAIQDLTSERIDRERV